LPEIKGQIGLGTGVVPEYEGSDDFGVIALPLIEVRKPGAFFLKGASINPNDGLVSAGVTIFHVSFSDKSGRKTQLVMDLLIRIHRGRDKDDNEVLEGMGDIDPNAGIGDFVEFTAGSWRINTTMSSQNVGDDKDGLMITFYANFTISVSYIVTFSHIL
jgi:outer membrane protein